MPNVPLILWLVIGVAALVLISNLSGILLPVLFAVAVYLLLKPYSRDQ